MTYISSLPFKNIPAWEENDFPTKKRLEVLAEHDAGTSVADLCRKHQPSPATLYKWKKDKATDED